MCCKIIHADCLEAMKDIPDKSIDMILCDLPYGTTSCSWDIVIDFDLLWIQYKRIVKDNACICLFGSQPFTTDLINSNREWFRYEWIWEKSKSTGIFHAEKYPMKTHENICIFGKDIKYNPTKYKVDNKYTDKRHTFNKSVNKGQYKGFETIRKKDDGWRFPQSILSFDSVWGKDMHPTQKPVKLFEYLIKTYTDENDIVLDNCAGSGTTGVACKRLGRKYILIEKEKKYIDIINKRLEKTIESMSLIDAIEKAEEKQISLFKE